MRKDNYPESIARNIFIMVIVLFVTHSWYGLRDYLNHTLNNYWAQKNGWISWYPNGITSHHETWGYKVNGKFMENYWVYYQNEWYYIASNKIMYDPRYEKTGTWRLTPISSGDTKKRWFEFRLAAQSGLNDRGALIPHSKGWDNDYYLQTGKWLYWTANNDGAATNETLTIDGANYSFNGDGICYQGKGCH